MSKRDLNKIVDEMIERGACEDEILYESGNIILDEIIPKVQAVLDRPYEISKEESEVIFPSDLSRNSESGVFLAVKYNGKDFDREDKDVAFGFEQMGYKIIPVLEDINRSYGVPISIRSMQHTFH